MEVERLKKAERITLLCTKKLQNGITDSFKVIVNQKIENDATKRYQDAGYKVKKI